jgi:predicted dehydrogenase
MLRTAGFDVKALVGVDAERTARRAAMLGVPVALTDVHAALALPGVTAVTIATPPHTHAALALAAIAAGKHVLCEKPFAADASEAAVVCAAASAAGVVTMMGHELRWLPAMVMLERAVAEGAIGEPRLATVIWLTGSFADPTTEVPPWWGDRDQGGGWLGAHASHVIDHLRATLGELEAVSAGLGLVSDHDWSAEDSYTVHFKTRGGVDGVLQSTWGAWGPMASMTRISGTKGTLWVDGPVLVPEAPVWLADRSGERQLVVPSEHRVEPADPAPPGLAGETTYAQLHGYGADTPGYRRLMATFRDLILERPVPQYPRVPTFADGLAHMLAIDAIRRSASEGSWVAVPTVESAMAAA